jgi:Zn-dependent protease with chaperone function
MFNMIAGRKCSAFIKTWYDHKYPVVTPLDELPRWLPGFVYVTKWTKLNGIDLPIAVVDSPIHTAMVVLDAMMVNAWDEYSLFEYIIITQSLMDILTNEEVMGVLHHEMRHAKRQWLLMVGHKRIINKMPSKDVDSWARI